MRFGVLGPLRAWTERGEPVEVPELKVRALLAVLLAHAGSPVPAGLLIDTLWDGQRLPAAPGRALQAKVSQLRRALAEAEPGARSLVVTRPPGYALRAGTGAVDADRFTALLTRARAEGDARTRAALLTDALGLWRGPAFAGFADTPAVRAAAARWEEERLTAVEDWADARLETGEHHELLGELADLTARHPWRERLRAAQLRALYRSGRQREALAAFEELRGALAEELGLDPGPELAALHQAILRQDPALGAPRDAVPEAGDRHRGGGLPAPLDALIGRADEVAAIRALLPVHRLVTLVGPGGVGKTRLALETAGDCRDGVRLVELAGLPGHIDAAGLAEEVAAAIGVRDDGVWGPRAPHRERPPAARLAEALRDRELLLLLDNCEHLIAPVAEVTQQLLRAAPGLRVLATSQEPLALPGEQVREVRPLDGEAAVRLFAARAAAAAPGFALGPGNATAVAELTRRLDGIPLALELAAGRVRTLGVPGLLARLDDRLRLLAGVRRGTPARQRTLRATLDWSWELLTDGERAVLRRLAVHAEGWSLASAEAVAGWGGTAPEDVLDALERLVERSLVSVGEGWDGPRYRMLESVTAYCAERLAEAGEADEARWRHHAHFAALAEGAAAGLRGPEQRERLALLDAEAANIRAALDGLVAGGRGAEALRLVNALAWYWLLRGRLGQARRSLGAALGAAGAAADAASRARAAAWHTGVAVLEGEGMDRARRVREVLRGFDGSGDPAGRAEAQWFLGHALNRIGDTAGARELSEGAMRAFRERGDRWGEAAALADRAVQALVHGDLAAVQREAERSAALFAELGDAWGQTQNAPVRAAHSEILGDYPGAVRRLREGLGTAESLGLSTMAADLTAGLGRIALLEGDLPGARELHSRAARRSAELGFEAGRVNAELGLALGDRRAGDLAAAEARLRRVLAWHRQVGLDSANALVLAELGFVAELRGDAVAALARQEEGLAVARTTGDDRAMALALEGLAGAHAVGRPELAAVLLGAADAARRGAGAPLPPAERGDVERITAAVRGRLGTAGFDGLFARGTALPPDGAYEGARSGAG